MADTASAVGSVFSSLSIFNKAEAQKARYEIIVEGELDIMPSDHKVKRNQSFEGAYCRLTRDGRISIDYVKGKSESYIVQECAITHDQGVFRLTVLSDTDLKADNSELIFRVDSEIDAATWLVGIECALRTRLQQFQNEMDCARGKLGILEYEGKNPDIKLIKWYQCFYYQNSFRVKGLDGPQTSTLEVSAMHIDEINYPMCFFLDCKGRKLVCKSEDPDQFRRWNLAISKDLLASEDNGQSDADIIEGDLLIGPSEDKLIRVKAKYYKSQRLLETTDFAGVIDSFQVARCTVAPKLKHHFTLTAKMPDIPGNNEMTLYVQCPDDASMKKWIKSICVPQRILQNLMKAAIKEIELRRIFHKEGSSKDKKRNVEFEEVHELASMKPAEADAALNNKEEWTVSKLERLNQVILKMLPEPIMPFENQGVVVALGQEILSKGSGDKMCQKAVKVFDSIPVLNREILEILTTHVWRLTTYYRKTHSSKASLPNTDETVWKRLTKYLFRINEQGLKPKEEELRAKHIAQVLVLFQKKTVAALSKQSEKSQSTNRKRSLSNQCKQS